MLPFPLADSTKFRWGATRPANGPGRDLGSALVENRESQGTPNWRRVQGWMASSCSQRQMVVAPMSPRSCG